MQRTIRLGTRASQLALWQANWAADTLRSKGFEVQLIKLSTDGDVLKGPLSQLGGDGLFTKRLQWALLQDEIDLAVHSLKDLPTDPTEGLSLAAVPEREDVRDAFVCNEFNSIEELPNGARVGTGSLRRAAQLKNLRPDLQVLDLRGNVDTRLRKLDENQYEAIILACAGLRRLGLEDRIRVALPHEVMLSAVGQGALGLEIRDNDSEMQEAIAPLNVPNVWTAVQAERSFLNETRAGCTAPVAGYATADNGQLQLEGGVWSQDGQKKIRQTVTGTSDQAEELGRNLARTIMAAGGQSLLDPET